MKANNTRLDDFVIPLFLSGLGGFDLAWTLMKNPRIDMSMNTGLLIPAGLLIGTIVGGLKAWRGFKMPRSLMVAVLVAVGLFSILPLMQVLANIHSASIVVPILIRDGFGAGGTDTDIIMWSALAFLGFGLVWSGGYLIRMRGRAEDS